MAKYDASWVSTSELIARWAATPLEVATQNGTVAAAIHAACYLCNCAIDAGLISHKEAIGDRGLVHELAHIAAGDTSRDIEALAITALDLETKLTTQAA